MSNKLNARIKNLGNVSIPEPEQGDMKLSVYPFEQDNIQLPKHFREYEDVLEEILTSRESKVGEARNLLGVDSHPLKETYVRDLTVMWIWIG
jgi:hypothetical protein